MISKEYGASTTYGGSSRHQDLFNVSAVIGFPKNGVDVTEIDIKIT